MQVLFPIVTICKYSTHSSTGRPDIEEVTCLLPLNVIYGPVLLFLHFWFPIMIVMSTLSLVLHLCTILPCSTRGRTWTLQRHLKVSDPCQIRQLAKLTTTNETFIIIQLARNIHFRIMDTFVSFLADKYTEEYQRLKQVNNHDEEQASQGLLIVNSCI